MRALLIAHFFDQAEHREVEGDHDRSHDGGDDGNDCRFHGLGESSDRRLDLSFVEVGKLFQHETELSGFFADTNHRDDELREDRALAQRDVYLLALLDEQNGATNADPDEFIGARGNATLEAIDNRDA